MAKNKAHWRLLNNTALGKKCASKLHRNDLKSKFTFWPFGNIAKAQELYFRGLRSSWKKKRIWKISWKLKTAWLCARVMRFPLKPCMLRHTIGKGFPGSITSPAKWFHTWKWPKIEHKIYLGSHLVTLYRLWMWIVTRETKTFVEQLGWSCLWKGTFCAETT